MSRNNKYILQTFDDTNNFELVFSIFKQYNISNAQILDKNMIIGGQSFLSLYGAQINTRLHRYLKKTTMYLSLVVFLGKISYQLLYVNGFDLLSFY